MTECNGWTSPEILANIPGLTYRQLDWWTRQGYIHNHFHLAGQRDRIASPRDRYSGYQGCWPLTQVDKIEKIYKLTQAGLDMAVAVDLADDQRVDTTIIIDAITPIEVDGHNYQQALTGQEP